MPYLNLIKEIIIADKITTANICSINCNVSYLFTSDFETTI